MWCCRSCQNLPLAPQGDSQHATWVEDPGILGANIVQTSGRLSEAPAAWASCLGKWPGLLGAASCPILEAVKAGTELEPALSCTTSSLHSALLPPGRRGARAGGKRGVVMSNNSC